MVESRQNASKNPQKTFAKNEFFIIEQSSDFVRNV